MKKLFSIIVFLGFICCNASENKEDYIITNDIECIEETVSKLEEGDIAIFDCDDVLTFTPYFTNKNGFKIVPIFNRIKSYKNVGTNEKAVEEMTKLLEKTPYTLVSEKMPNLVKILQEKNVKTLVLTQCGSGKCGALQSMSQWKLSNLKRLGYDFKQSWNKLDNSAFSESLEKITCQMVIKSVPETATFIDGALFAGMFKKEIVLKEFLKYSKQKPKRILYIDDIKKNVDSIKKVAQELGVEYIGIVYTAVEDSKFDEKCAQALEAAKIKLDESFPSSNS